MIKSTNIAILGSTGSIGTQTLDVIRQNKDSFKVGALTANNNWRLLAQQAKEFKPKRVVIANEQHLRDLKEALSDLDVEVECGHEAVAHAAAMPECDTVVTALVGYSGLLPTIHAIGAGKKIALSNKETLVVAGELIHLLLKKSDSEIIPVDSEHSAIFQCLEGEKSESFRKIILTASGGPFRKLTRKELENVTVSDALKHPNWNMGAKVTIDSASMMNKGFEMIEAKWLFNCQPDDIEIIVHPQSVIHSMVEFCDGSIKAQLGVPDMRLPIRYALSYPYRLNTDNQRLDFKLFPRLTFEEVDYEKFPLLKMAFEAIAEGGTTPCILNAANEVGVAAFLEGKIKFTDLPKLVGKTLDIIKSSDDISLNNLVETNREAVKAAQEQISHFR